MFYLNLKEDGKNYKNQFNLRTTKGKGGFLSLFLVKPHFEG